jgi:TRAP transporter TAXI family solute receptor
VIAAVVLVAVVLWRVVAAFHPMPPHTVVMVTGPEGGAYYEFGKLYRELLARQGIDLQLLPTAGSLENLSRLRDPGSKAEIGFLQGGITSKKESPGLESLGTISYEPLWFFSRSVLRSRGLNALRGKKISIGPEGSGTRALALELLARNGIDPRFAELLPLTPQVAGERLLRNEIDAAFMVTSWDSPVVRRLLADKNIELASFPRTDAYIALYPFLNKLTVPEGAGDLAGNRPSTNVLLFAPKASLVVRKDLHPAIQYLLLNAADQIHSGPGIFQKAGQFPASESIDLPLSDEARQFFKSGRPFLQRHLPFWLAVVINQLLILIIPAIGLIYPLLRLMPAAYGYQIRRRIYRLHSELWSLDEELESRSVGQNIDDLVAQLDTLEDKGNHLRVPLFYSNMMYTWRIHIGLVRERTKMRAAKP